MTTLIEYKPDLGLRYSITYMNVCIVLCNLHQPSILECCKLYIQKSYEENIFMSSETANPDDEDAEHDAISNATFKSNYKSYRNTFLTWIKEKDGKRWAWLIKNSDQSISSSSPQPILEEIGGECVFKFIDKDAALRWMALMLKRKTENPLFQYCKNTRKNVYYPKKSTGIWNHEKVRSSFTRLLEGQFGLTWTGVHAAADKNMSRYYKGLLNSGIDKARREGWEGHAKVEIPVQIYQAIALVLLQSGGLQYWVMFLLQWNLISRRQDIARIILSSISWSKDLLVIHYTHEKTDKTRSKLKAMHLASNPKLPEICPVFALSLYLASQQFDNLKLFTGGSQANTYSKELSKAIEDPRVVKLLKEAGIDPDGIGTHSLRKSAATFCAGGSERAPMHFTILLRGGWSIGSVLDRYFKLADKSDSEIAMLLACRNMYEKEFAQLVPHFKKPPREELLKSVFVGEAFALKGLQAALPFLLANLLYHLVAKRSSILVKIESIYPNLINKIGTICGKVQGLVECLGPDYAPNMDYFLQPTGQGVACLMRQLLKANEINNKNGEKLDYIIERIDGNIPAKKTSENYKDVLNGKHVMDDKLQKIYDKLVDMEKDRKRGIEAEAEDEFEPSNKRAKKSHVKKATNWKMPKTFSDFLWEYIFPGIGRAALRTCKPLNLFPERAEEEDDAKYQKKYRAFKVTWSRCTRACKMFLQHAFNQCNTEFKDFLGNNSDRDYVGRTAKFNVLMESAFKSFNNLVFPEQRRNQRTQRKRKIDRAKTSAVTICNHCMNPSFGTGDYKNYYEQILRDAGIEIPETTKGKNAKQPKYTYKLPTVRSIERSK